MQEFDIKRGHFKKIDGGKLEDLMRQYFKEVNTKEDWLESNYGAMRPIRVKIKDKKTLFVEIITSTDVSDDDVSGTIKAKNGFLWDATGFNTKQRFKRLQKKAKEGSL